MLTRSSISVLSHLRTFPLQGRIHPQLSVRSIATARASELTSPVPLSFTEVPKPSPQAALSQPVVILHGLFGSKQNWKALSKAMASRLNTRVFAVDLRNHGESSHSEVHDYANMANDITQFLKEQDLDKPIIIGHSMGGKVAMTMALKHASLDRLVVVDMAPVKVKLTSEFANYVAIMKEIQKARVKKQSEADAMMKKGVDDLGVRQFLLTNLKKNTGGDGYSFRVPLDVLADSLENLGQFDFVSGEVKYDGKALFIKGNKSNYVRSNEEALIKEFFPKARIEGLETGHWVHAEKPDQFLKLVTEFAVEK